MSRKIISLCVLQILKQFGPLGRDIEKLRRFAVYRAAEIKKALDSGSMPPSIMPLQAGSSVPDMGPLSPCMCSELTLFLSTMYSLSI